MRVVLRITDNTMAFAATDDNAEGHVAFEPYIVKSGISMAANLREAFKTSDLLLNGYKRAMVMLSTPVLLVPVEEYDEHTLSDMYNHTLPGHDGETLISGILPNLNAVAVFPMNKDLKLVIDDHFTDVVVATLAQPMWSYLHQRSFTGLRNKLYAYFHDKKMDVFSFNKNRFKFYNCFDATHINDTVYYLLNVWKQLAMDTEKDELHVVGDIPEKETLLETLRAYLQKAYVINPTADFNRNPITAINDMPLDLATLFIKGR